jgi:hypothetical protein
VLQKGIFEIMSQAADCLANENVQHTPVDGSPSSSPEEHEAVLPPTSEGEHDYFGEVKNSDLAGKAATIAVVGAGVALISAELLPGMLIGVAAAFLPGLSNKWRPLFKSTIRAGYSAVRKTRELMAEAGEQVRDVVAEVKTETVPPIPTPQPAANQTPGV